MDQVKADIFMTEYFTIDSEKVSLLPQITKTPKTAATLKNLKIITSKNKSATSSSINLSHRRLTSPTDQSLDTFESRFQKFRADITERAKTGTSSIKHSEIDPRIILDVANIERQVASKQKSFNKIRHEVEKKKELLEKMKSELASIKKEDTSLIQLLIDKRKNELKEKDAELIQYLTDKRKNEQKEKDIESTHSLTDKQKNEIKDKDTRLAYSLMEKRINELKEIQAALLNERHYKETLDFLLNQKKNDLPEQEKTVVNMRESLRLKKKELTELKNDCEREKQEILNLEKSSDHLKESIQQTKDLFDATYKKNVQVFSQKAKFRETLENEHELNKKTHQQKEIERKIKELKCDLANIEKEEANSAEEQKRTDYQNFMEEEYLKVKAEGVSNKPKKLSAEFEELQIKKENLDKDKDQSIEKIQALSAEWQKLNNELNEIVLNHEADRKINHREFERIELSLKEKNKQMNESEKILNNLEFIISSICGSVSRIGVMLDEEKTYVKPRQLKKHFDYFIIGIESRLKFITQQVFSEEKIRELSFKFPNFVSIYCKNKTSEDSDLWQ